MKKSILCFGLLALLAITNLTSCKKYDEGPILSFRSRAERVANNWKVENYKVNGSDLTSLVADYSEQFTKGGDYSYTWGILDGTGTWAFQNHDEEIKLTGTDDQASRNLIIEKLEEDTFWYYFMDGDDKYEVHLVAN